MTELKTLVNTSYTSKSILYDKSNLYGVLGPEPGAICNCSVNVNRFPFMEGLTIVLTIYPSM